MSILKGRDMKQMPGTQTKGGKQGQLPPPNPQWGGQQGCYIEWGGREGEREGEGRGGSGCP